MSEPNAIMSLHLEGVKQQLDDIVARRNNSLNLRRTQLWVLCTATIESLIEIVESVSKANSSGETWHVARSEVDLTVTNFASRLDKAEQAFDESLSTNRRIDMELRRSYNDTFLMLRERLEHEKNAVDTQFKAESENYNVAVAQATRLNEEWSSLSAAEDALEKKHEKASSRSWKSKKRVWGLVALGTVSAPVAIVGSLVTYGVSSGRS
jgi:hypothetical protein